MKNSCCLGIKDIYNFYKQKASNPLNYKEYKQVFGNFTKHISKKLLETGEIKLPQKLGYLRVVGKKVKIKIENEKIKGLTPDWKKTKELWNNNEESKKNKEIVYNFNENTNCVRYKFFWKKEKVYLENKFFYYLIMSRSNKRNLAKKIKSGKEYYIYK